MYLNYIPIVFFWSISTYVRKSAYKYLNNYEYLLLTNFIYSFVLLGFFSFLIKPQIFVDKLKIMPSILYVKAIGVCFLWVASTFALYNLINNNINVNYIVPVARGFSQILILLIGFYFYSIKITRCTVIGSLLIIFGIYLI
jgi:drug/metabolite transporter (DMT)-like permease